MDREVAVKMQAYLMCAIVGIDPVDDNNGSPNWWKFAIEAEKIVDDIQIRYPPRERRQPT